MNNSNFKLYFYYSDSCSCCKNYKEVVDKITQELKIDASYIDIATGIPTHHLDGVPTIAINDSQGKTIYKHVGNLPYDSIIKKIKEAIGYDK